MYISNNIHLVEGQGFDSNMYMILNERKEITLVDTGHDGHRKYLLDYIKQIGCDHSGGLSWLVKKYKPRVNVCEIEAYAIEEGDMELTLAGMVKGSFDETHVDRQLKHGESFSWGEHEFEVLVTPGHTKGSICLLDRKQRLLISGDTVFADGSAAALQKSLDHLATLDIDIMLPGHMHPVLRDASRHVKTSAKFARMMG
jgi:hydroxyacylglutathione hydrolase